MNLKARIKNPYFWLGLISTFLLAIQVDPSTLTSWPILAQNLRDFVENPFLIGTAIVAVVGVLTDTSTPGLTDKEDE